jgi:ATP-dependent Clp protease, protease subunit
MLAISLILYFMVNIAFSLISSPRNNLLAQRQHISRLFISGQTPMVPYFPNPSSKDYVWMDIYNALGRKRTIFVSRYIDDEACNQLVASLVYLQSADPKEPVTLYLNVPGAMVKPTLAIYDVMKKMSCPIRTINMGLTVGMSCLIAAGGDRGQRFAFPNARFLVAKAGLEDGIQGQSADIALHVQEVN